MAWSPPPRWDVLDELRIWQAPLSTMPPRIIYIGLHFTDRLRTVWTNHGCVAATCNNMQWGNHTPKGPNANGTPHAETYGITHGSEHKHTTCPHTHDSPPVSAAPNYAQQHGSAMREGGVFNTSATNDIWFLILTRMLVSVGFKSIRARLIMLCNDEVFILFVGVAQVMQ